MRNKLTDELAVCGLNAVLAAGKYHGDAINRLFIREDRFPVFTGICKELAKRKRPYKICEDEELERICKSVHHQGVVAMIEEPVIPPLTIDDLDDWADDGKTGLVLHSVGNDHNLGAIARAAAFFEIDLIVLNEKDDEARLTTAAYRVAEGAMEHVTFRSVNSTAKFLHDASKQIITIGTDAKARMRIRDLSAIVSTSKEKGIALVLGNEETGLPQSVRSQCSCMLRIPGSGKIESLNVSQAAALFLHAIYEL